MRVYDDNDDTVLKGELIDTLCKLRLTLFEVVMAKEIAIAAVIKKANHRKVIAIE